MKSNLSDLVRVLPFFIIMTFMNVFITFTASEAVLYLLLDKGADRSLSLAISIVTAMVVMLYISYNHKAKLYFKPKE